MPCSLCRSDSALQMIMYLALAAHLLEALYVLRLCLHHKAPLAHSLGWVLLTCLLGYPALDATQQALRSSSMNRKGK